MRLDLYALCALFLKYANLHFFTTTVFNQGIVLNMAHWPAFAHLLRYNSLFLKTAPVAGTAINKNKSNLLTTCINLIYIFIATHGNIKMHCVITNQSPFKCFDLSCIFNGLTGPIREMSEMFNLHFSSKIDARRLLLEYTSEISPMLKTFACEGYEELEYSIKERGLVYKPLKARDEINF